MPNAARNANREVVDIGLPHVSRGNIHAQHLFGNGVEQQAGRGIGVVGVFFDQGAGRQDGCLVDLLHGHAVVQVAHGLGHDGVGLNVGPQTLASASHDARQSGQIQHHTLTLVDGVQNRCRHGAFSGFVSSLLRALFAVEHIGPSDLMVAAAHQAKLHLVLYIFNVKRATGRARTQQRANHRLGQHLNGFAHAGRRSALGPVHRQKRFHHGHGDLGGLERHHGTIATNDLVLGEFATGVG